MCPQALCTSIPHPTRLTSSGSSWSLCSPTSQAPSLPPLAFLVLISILQRHRPWHLPKWLQMWDSCLTGHDIGSPQNK